MTDTDSWRAKGNSKYILALCKKNNKALACY